MDWARIQADWQHYKALARQRWMKLSAADLDLIAGRRELLAAHIQQTYGISKNAAPALSRAREWPMAVQWPVLSQLFAAART